MGAWFATALLLPVLPFCHVVAVDGCPGFL